MDGETVSLAAMAASIAFFHTLIGPDHVLPFVALAKSRGWSSSKTAVITASCGLAHAAGSIILGLIVILVGSAFLDWANIEAIRGEMAAWGLIGFGTLYAIWGLRQANREHSHTHAHCHTDGGVHAHHHDHSGGHVHVHESAQASPATTAPRFAPWAIFVIFLLGPCETLIPLMLVPAASANWLGLGLTVVVFTLVTVLSMVAIVTLSVWGLRGIEGRGFARHAHSLAGGTMVVGGVAVMGLGL